jgi:uncharacterized damage-inducible protein DinB
VRLRDVFDGWGGYQTSLVHAIEPLSTEQLSWKPSANVRSIGEIARHIALGRISWFVRMKAPRSDELAAKIDVWDHDPHGNAYVREEAIAITGDAGALSTWLGETWTMIDRTLNAWTVEDLAAVYRHVWRGDVYEISRQWTVWRIMAHDIHHGGQIARILAERNIDAFELRALGGHIVSPMKIGKAEDRP